MAVIDSAAMVETTPSDLSRSLATKVFNLHVHDSDFWTYVLFEAGKQIDTFTSVDEQDYFGGPIEDPEAIEGNPASGNHLSNDERWKLLTDCFDDGVTRDDFEKAFAPVDFASPNFEFASGEEGLGKFLSMIGANATLAHLSYRYWIDDPNFQGLVEFSHMRFDRNESTSQRPPSQHPASHSESRAFSVLPNAPLHNAAANNDLDKIEELVRAGTDVDSIPPGLVVTPLSIAASDANVETIRKLVSLGAKIDCMGKAGSTPLHFAVQGSRVENVRELVKLGADPNLSSELLGTPLRYAVKMQSCEMVETLIELGADVDRKSESAQTLSQEVDQMLQAMNELPDAFPPDQLEALTLHFGQLRDGLIQIRNQLNRKNPNR